MWASAGLWERATANISSLNLIWTIPVGQERGSVAELGDTGGFGEAEDEERCRFLDELLWLQQVFWDHEWGSSSSTDESSPVGNKSDFSDVFDCKNLREGIKFEDRCCIMHSPLKQVMECLISIQPPSCEGSSPASCIMHPTTLPPNRLQHTQTDNGRLILSPLWCHEYWFENTERMLPEGELHLLWW